MLTRLGFLLLIIIGSYDGNPIDSSTITHRKSTYLNGEMKNEQIYDVFHLSNNEPNRPDSSARISGIKHKDITNPTELQSSSEEKKTGRRLVLLSTAESTPTTALGSYDEKLIGHENNWTREKRATKSDIFSLSKLTISTITTKIEPWKTSASISRFYEPRNEISNNGLKSVQLNAVLYQSGRRRLKTDTKPSLARLPMVSFNKAKQRNALIKVGRLKPVFEQSASPLRYMIPKRFARNVNQLPINFSVPNVIKSMIWKIDGKPTDATQNIQPTATWMLPRSNLVTLRQEQPRIDVLASISTLVGENFSFENKSVKTNLEEDRWDLHNRTVDYSLGFYAVATLIGCLGNIYVLVDAIKALKTLHTNEIFLILLCIINLKTLLTLSIMVIFLKIRYMNTCHVIFSLTSVYLYGMVYTFTTISIQQYNAIAFPFNPKPSWTKLLCICMVISLLSVALSLPVILRQDLLPRPCVIEQTFSLPSRRLYYSLTALFQYAFPLFITGIYYIKLGIFLKRSRLEMERHSDQPQFQSPRKKRDRRVVVVMVAIVISFALCLLPQHIQFLTIEFITDDLLYNGMAVFTYFPILLKACIDPVIYGAVGRKLRSRCCCSFRRTSVSSGSHA